MSKLTATRAGELACLAVLVHATACGTERGAEQQAVGPGALVTAALPRFLALPADALDPDDPRCGRAQQLIREGKFGEARQILESSMADSHAAARVRFLLGYSHHKEKRYAQARPYFEEVLQLGPRFQRAYVTFYFYAWCLWYLGELEGARLSFEATLEFDPSERDAHYGLGLIALERGQLEEAEARFQRSMELARTVATAAPGNARVERQVHRDLAKALARLGDLELTRGRLDAAKTRLESSLELNPAGYEAWFKLYRVLTRLGDEEGAAVALRVHREQKRFAGR